MPSLYDPHHDPRPLLEPANLLEPLDLTQQQPDRIPPAVRAKEAGRSQRGGRQLLGMRRASRSERRSLVSPILVLAGAVACFGAGTFFPQLQMFTRGNVEPGPIVATASRPSEPKSVQAKSDTPTPQASSAGTAFNTTATGLDTNAVSGDHAPSAAAQPRQPAEPAKPAEAAPNAHHALAGCAVLCDQQPCPKDDANCLEGGPSPKGLISTGGSASKRARATDSVRQAATPQSADPERVETRPSAPQEVRQDARPQPSRLSKRAAQRERTDRQAGATRNAATVSAWSRAEDRSDWRRETTQGRRKERDWDRRENPLMTMVPPKHIEGSGARASLPTKRPTGGFWDWN
jgi:hypothetical protein